MWLQATLEWIIIMSHCKDLSSWQVTRTRLKIVQCTKEKSNCRKRITFWSLCMTLPLCMYLVAFRIWYIMYRLWTSLRIFPRFITLCKSVSGICWGSIHMKWRTSYLRDIHVLRHPKILLTTMLPFHSFEAGIANAISSSKWQKIFMSMKKNKSSKLIY